MSITLPGDGFNSEDSSKSTVSTTLELSLLAGIQSVSSIPSISISATGVGTVEALMISPFLKRRVTLQLLLTENTFFSLPKKSIIIIPPLQ